MALCTRYGCRTMAILLGTTGQAGLTVRQVQVAIRRGYIDPTGLYRLPVGGMTRREWTSPVEDAGQGAGNGPREVDHYED